MQTRCVVKGEAQKSPLFWRSSGVFDCLKSACSLGIRLKPVNLINHQYLGQESCRTKVSRIFRIFVPNFAPNFAPNFPRIFRGLSVLRFVGDGDQKKFTKNPRHFSMQNSQANTQKIFTKFFWRAGKVTILTNTSCKSTCLYNGPRLLGRLPCRTKLPPKNFNLTRKTVWKTRKKIRKTIRNVFEKCLAPLRPLKIISPALFTKFKSFSPPKICTNKKSFVFTARPCRGSHANRLHTVDLRDVDMSIVLHVRDHHLIGSWDAREVRAHRCCAKASQPTASSEVSSRASFEKRPASYRDPKPRNPKVLEKKLKNYPPGPRRQIPWKKLKKYSKIP